MELFNEAFVMPERLPCRLHMTHYLGEETESILDYNSYRGLCL